MIKVVIFDADGPLYFRKSEVAQKKRSLLAEFGYTGDPQKFEDAYEKEKFKGYVGSETVEEMFQNILRTIGLDIPFEKAITFTKKFDTLQRQVTTTKDASTTLELLKNTNYKICVLTDSCCSAEEKWAWFKGLGMSQFLDYVASSRDTRKLKDAPEAYQACLDSLGINSDEAVFVGHQEYEMIGARASKIISVAVLPIATPEVHSDYAVNSLAELPGLLEKIDRR